MTSNVQLNTLLDEIEQLDLPAQAGRQVELLRQALSLADRQAKPLQWAALRAKLGAALRAWRTDDYAEHVAEAIACFQDALAVFDPAQQPDVWAVAHFELGGIYLEQVSRAPEQIEPAIVHLEQALSACRGESLVWLAPDLHSMLSSLYSQRRQGDPADNAEQTLAHLLAATDAYAQPDTLLEWAQAQIALAEAYRQRRFGNRADNLEAAITCAKQALQGFDPAQQPDFWAESHNVLGSAYLDRLEGETADNVEQAIAHFQQALQIYSREAYPDRWAMLQNNLGVAWLGRIEGNFGDNVEQALACHQKALEVYNRESSPQAWAFTQTQLAGPYLQRVSGAEADNLAQAVEHYRQALTIFTRADEPYQWARANQNLGVAYSRLAATTPPNVAEAQACFEAALTVYTLDDFPAQWAGIHLNIGNLLAEQYRAEQSEEALQQVVDHYRRALAVYERNGFPADQRQTLHNLADLYAEAGRWAEAQAAYEQAIDLGARQLAVAFTPAGRQEAVWLTARLYAPLAYSRLQQGQLETALIWLERGKTRLLNKALSVSDESFDSLSNAQRETLREAQQRVQRLENALSQPQASVDLDEQRRLAAALQAARRELDQLVESLKALGAPPPAELDLGDILALAPEGGAMLLPLITAQGSAVFVIPAGLQRLEAEYLIWLDSWTRDDLLRLLQGSTGGSELGGWLGAYAHRNSQPEAWLETINATTQLLWEELLGPVEQRLETLGVGRNAPILLMPQGGLGLLPLHAAWRQVEGQQRTFLDDHPVTYGPSATVLSISRQRLAEDRPEQRSLLAVVDPTADLAFASTEGGAVAAFFDSDARRLLSQDEATPDAVVAGVAGRSHLHFACHGTFDWQHVERSSLLLADQQALTVADIRLSLDLSAARLVTLSACETSMTRVIGVPDEQLGLPAAFLQAGAPGVIGTLWPVDDLSTTLLVERFYQHHFHDRLEISEALRRAQVWLRDVSAGELVERFSAERQAVLEGESPLPAEVVSRQYRRFNRLAPDAQPFAHPYYWAAFTFSGA